MALELQCVSKVSSNYNNSSCIKSSLNLVAPFCCPNRLWERGNALLLLLLLLLQCGETECLWNGAANGPFVHLPVAMWMNVEYRLNEIDKTKLNVPEKNLSQYQVSKELQLVVQKLALTCNRPELYTS